ncbi:DUF5722 domain-containing protein [Planctomicrobium sp. SH668]|uniref:DUF5722 domain-containing protein n=1 Tax=Planctomicrobium sp. SH668 TaxID=3448126 RepID=UPI003F5B55DA
MTFELISLFTYRILLCVSVLNGLVCLDLSAGEEAFPHAKSKKGLQVQIVDDAIELGVQHAAININLSLLIDPAETAGGPFWELDGKKFHFRPHYLRGLESQIRPLSDRGILVYLIVLVYASGDPAVDRILLHPNYSQSAPNRLSGFNTLTDEGREWLQATFSFMGHRWRSTEAGDGRVVGYIIGNEVNSHREWSNVGEIPADEFIEQYLKAVRLAFNSVRSQDPAARIYLSLDHFWGRGLDDRPMQTMGGKYLVDRFAQRARETGDFEWHLAYHPYPEDLFNPAFWNDQSPTSNDDSPRITFKNLEVLTAYFERDELLFNGRTRSIILSEQGFNSRESVESLQEQAAAYCLAWKKVERLPTIEAFIYHRHVDHAHEGGLNLGLWTRRPNSVFAPSEKKPIYQVFQKADTPEWEDAFRFALPIIGADGWDDALTLGVEQP